MVVGGPSYPPVATPWGRGVLVTAKDSAVDDCNAGDCETDGWGATFSVWVTSVGAGVEVTTFDDGNDVPFESGMDVALPVDVAKLIASNGGSVGVVVESESDRPEKKIDRIVTRNPTINRMTSTDLFFCSKLMIHL